MNFFEITGDSYIPTYTRTDFTDDLHDAFGFRTDYQIVKYKTNEKNFQEYKNKNITHFLKNKKPENR